MKVISIVGKQKTGKTSLIERLIASLKHYGTVGCIKHAQELELAMPIARDTDRFFTAGADVVVGVSGERSIKLSGPRDLTDLIEEMARSDISFLLVEGFKSSALPKIALSDYLPHEVRNVRKRVELKSGTEIPDTVVKELVEFILALDEYA
ncbi:MAG TPA: molybdopterin-guanine dinucleotide biosynthesis protein B [Methanomicrobia archaeon]|nr:molybdopterin-guanine dinucleotide biosynthesis protein B [Methanomicrobia archaeon]